jgi:hypothetical protein
MKDWLFEQLEELAGSVYENDVGIMVAKLHAKGALLPPMVDA